MIKAEKVPPNPNQKVKKISIYWNDIQAIPMLLACFFSRVKSPIPYSPAPTLRGIFQRFYLTLSLSSYPRLANHVKRSPPHHHLPPPRPQSDTAAIHVPSNTGEIASSNLNYNLL